MGCGRVIKDFGCIPVTAALGMARALMRAQPQADAIVFPSPHWPVIEAIEALEEKFGVTVMAAVASLRVGRGAARGHRCAIHGYGRLLRHGAEFPTHQNADASA